MKGGSHAFTVDEKDYLVHRLSQSISPEDLEGVNVVEFVVKILRQGYEIPGYNNTSTREQNHAAINAKLQKLNQTILENIKEFMLD